MRPEKAAALAEVELKRQRISELQEQLKVSMVQCAFDGCQGTSGAAGMHLHLGLHLRHLLLKHEIPTVCLYRVHMSGDKSVSRSWTLHAAPGARLKRLLAKGSRRQRPP